MFGLISKKKVTKILKKAYMEQEHCGGDWATHKCKGNYYDRHNAINWIASALKLKKDELGNWFVLSKEECDKLNNKS